MLATLRSPTDLLAPEGMHAGLSWEVTQERDGGAYRVRFCRAADGDYLFSVRLFSRPEPDVIVCVIEAFQAGLLARVAT